MTAEKRAEPTPGPWMLHDMERATVVTVEKPGQFIALCDGISLSDEVNAANADFIAAAPDTAAERDRLKVVNAELVDAMGEVTDVLERTLKGCSRDFPYWQRNAVEDARAAIKEHGATS